MAEYVFGWLPVRALIAIAFFIAALVLFVNIERTRKTGKLHLWIVGLSFWTVGMVFDGLRRVEGWVFLRVVEHLLQLGGSIIIAYAAYEANRRLKGRAFLSDRGEVL